MSMHGGIVGQYRITGLLGQGGMGAVYAAEHTLLGRLAAVKVLLPEYSHDQEIVTRFFNEARAATAVRHPGIVEIYDFGWHTDGSAYIAMERLDGQSLSARSAHRPMPWSAALTIVRQIAGVLAAAHAKGIVHRDLKPDNVFLVPDPEVPGGERIKLLDFGIAKLAGDKPTQHKTRTGAVIGTPTYMAPEQCRGVSVDHRADLYSLGCILFELCTGRAPFVGEGAGDVLAAHIHVPVPAMSSLVKGVPVEVERLVQRLLAKQPNERMQTGEEVIKSIDVATRALSQSGPQAIVSSRLPRAASPVSITTLSGAAGPTLSTRPKRTPYVAIGAVVVVIAVASMIFVATRGSEQTASAIGASGSEPASPPKPAARPEPAVSPPVIDAAAEVVTPGPTPQKPQTVEIAVDSIPSGAEVVLSGVVLGKTPFREPVAYSESDVSLVVRLRGYVEKTVVVRPDRSITQRIKLVAVAPPPSQQKPSQQKPSQQKPPQQKPNRDGSVNPFGN
jgi:eukaryotic-like serine/threonine-protein kinase